MFLDKETPETTTTTASANGISSSHSSSSISSSTHSGPSTTASLHAPTTPFSTFKDSSLAGSSGYNDYHSLLANARLQADSVLKTTPPLTTSQMGSSAFGYIQVRETRTGGASTVFRDANFPTCDVIGPTDKTMLSCALSDTRTRRMDEMNATVAEIISPVDGATVAHVQLLSRGEALERVERSKAAFEGWRKTPLKDRIAVINRFIDRFMSKRHEICRELSRLMGRPFKQNYGELVGFELRARHIVSIAEESLADWQLPEKQTFVRFVRREPLGVTFVLTPWNYPYMCTVHTLITSLLAGNTVLCKMSPQTFVCGERFAACIREAGLPEGVFEHLVIDHPTCSLVAQHPAVQFIQFTGSLNGGKEIAKAVNGRFIHAQYEMGGKDPAYVRADCNLTYAAEHIMFLSNYNSGQSCFAVERIYVHESVYDEFLEKCAEVLNKYKVDDPLLDDTTIGPVVSVRAAGNIRAHINEALQMGAKKLIDESIFPKCVPGSAYVAPQLLLNVDHRMKIMREETFGPVAGVMKVSSDEEAIRLMNDNEYGLTASVWTTDEYTGVELCDRLDFGTVFLNRGDWICPELPWTACKNSGIGVTLNKLGFDQVTRPKSFHLRPSQTHQ